MKIKNDKMKGQAFYEFLKQAFAAAASVLKDAGAFYIWFASREHINVENAIMDAGLRLHQELIWNKNSIVLGRSDFQYKHEPCFYGWKGSSHNWYGDRKQTTVMDFKKPLRNGEHPTMKPVELFAYLINCSSKVGDSILDLFGGSGTTLIAAEQLHRKCYMMELDEHYCDVIIARWEKLTGGKATKITNINQPSN